MIENTNKAIIVNSVVLYVQIGINTICSLLTTRFALKALGVDDFGLFSVLGGIISFISVFNTIMVTTSNRFIAVAIGKGSINEANEQFNVNRVIHTVIAIATILLALPIGDWYIHHFVNYNGETGTAISVFNISIIGAIISFLGVPYYGLLMAKERFVVFSTIDVIVHILKLLMTISLLFFFDNKLIIYTITLSLLAAIPTIVYHFYCTKHFQKITKFCFIKKKRMYKDVFSFSLWIGYGAIASIGKGQGAALLVNGFFNTVMNAALGVANSINSYLVMFSHIVSNPIAPQLTKCYAAGNMARVETLLSMSTKLSYLAMLAFSCPFLVEGEWLLGLWLEDVPPFAMSFLTLLIMDALATSLISGVNHVVFASGKIAFYQITNNTLRLLSIALAFLFLRRGLPAYSLFYAYIAMSLVIFVGAQMIISKQQHINIRNLCRKSYYPSALVTILFIPVLFIKIDLNPIIHIIVTFLYLCVLIILLGLNTSEKAYLRNIVKKR